jgi:hypothetical protein
LLADLYRALPESSARASALVLESDWCRHWTVSCRQVDCGEVVAAVGELSSMPISRCCPVRGFTWRTRQRHRPGLQYVASTGRHRGFESVAEQQLLLALDFVGARRHVPDFLAVLPEGTWLFDVRPAGRVKQRPRRRWRQAGVMRW